MQVERPPGERLSLIARLSMSAKAHRQFIWPTLQDLHIEYVEATKAGDRMRALLVLIRGYRSMALPWLYGVLARVISLVFST